MGTITLRPRLGPENNGPVTVGRGNSRLQNLGHLVGGICNPGSSGLRIKTSHESVEHLVVILQCFKSSAKVACDTRGDWRSCFLWEAWRRWIRDSRYIISTRLVPCVLYCTD